MAQKRIQPGVAYTASGEKKISGSAGVVPVARGSRVSGPTDMKSGITPVRTNLPRKAFQDQKKVNTTYRWK